MSNRSPEIHRLTGSLGAEVTGVDLLHLSESAFESIHQALLDHEVLFFRGCALDDESQMALAYRFGQPSIFPVLELLGATEPTFQVIEDGPDSPNEADYWHTDVTWTAEPPKIALLRAGIIPAAGGDTAWASMSAAYEALSPAMRDFVCQLEVCHDNEFFIEAVQRKMKFSEESENLARGLREKFPPVVHPLVRTHPETGRKALYINRTFTTRINELSAAESDAMLAFLFAHIEHVNYQIRFRWSLHDMAFWDNRCCMHRAIWDYWPEERKGRRVTVKGDIPA